MDFHVDTYISEIHVVYIFSTETGNNVFLECRYLLVHTGPHSITT